jgi:hypothetical protein
MCPGNPSDPKTTKELLDIATRHASGKEAVGAAFTLVTTGTTSNGKYPPIDEIQDTTLYL